MTTHAGESGGPKKFHFLAFEETSNHSLGRKCVHMFPLRKRSFISSLCSPFRARRVIVGAPRANSSYSGSVRSPGAVYKCRVHSNPERRCTEMDLGRGQSPPPGTSTPHTPTFVPEDHAHPYTTTEKVPNLVARKCAHLQSPHTLQASVLFYPSDAASSCSSQTSLQTFLYGDAPWVCMQGSLHIFISMIYVSTNIFQAC